MGKASRRKKIRRIVNSSHDIKSPSLESSSTAPAVLTQADAKKVEPVVLPDVVYRFIDPQYADDFIRGKIQVSTLERCRQYEDPKQGDRDEGQHVRYLESINIGDGSDLATQKLTKEMGLSIHPKSKNIRLLNMVRVSRLPDCFVLCTTLRYAPETFSENFGKACVEIRDPLTVFHLISKVLYNRHPLRRRSIGKVTYADRRFRAGESPGSIGFVKPRDPYSDQEEFRMLWIPETEYPIVPEILEVPEIAKYCRRIA